MAVTQWPRTVHHTARTFSTSVPYSDTYNYPDNRKEADRRRRQAHHQYTLAVSLQRYLSHRAFTLFVVKLFNTNKDLNQSL